MTTQRRLTRPGPTDNEHMVVTCTPDTTAVEFFEFQDEALEAARENIHPTTSTYLGKVTHQGEHSVRGSSKHIALLAKVDHELWQALRGRCAHGRRTLAAFLQSILQERLDLIRSEYRRGLDEDKTQPGSAEAEYIKAGEQVYGHALVHGSLPPPRPAAVVAGTSGTSRGLNERNCDPGDKCENFPACESCGPARQ